VANKVERINLEYNQPTVEQAITKLKSALSTAKNSGAKAIIIIHGYGSSGEGGKIKPAVTRYLADDSMRGIVRLFTCGDSWVRDKREFNVICGSLSDYEREISGNAGVTVVLFR
jgi:hypothetical protein